MPTIVWWILGIGLVIAIGYVVVINLHRVHARQRFLDEIELQKRAKEVVPHRSETSIRIDRDIKLHNLAADLRQAEHLMELEEEAMELRDRYARSQRTHRPRSPTVEEILNRFREEADRLKREAYS